MGSLTVDLKWLVQPTFSISLKGRETFDLVLLQRYSLKSVRNIFTEFPTFSGISGRPSSQLLPPSYPNSQINLVDESRFNLQIRQIKFGDRIVP